MTNPKVEVLSIAQGATPDLQNVNKHTQRGRGLHENSMRKRGAGRSIFSAGAGVDVPVVMGGNQTLEIAATLGMEIINVHTTGNQIVNVVRDDIAPGSPDFYAMGIEDNEIGKLSYNPDVDILAAVMADPAMQALKAEDRMLADIVEGMGMPKETKDAEPQTDRAGELAEKWQTASGQLWKLGDHRLLIGDCTVRENVERLMGGERIDCVFTSPPYNQGGKGKRLAPFYGGEGDERTKDEYKEFLFSVLSEMAAICNQDASILWNVMYNANSRDDYGKIVFSDRNPFLVQETIIWDKGHGFNVSTKGILSRNSEIIFLMSLGDEYQTKQGQYETWFNTWKIGTQGSQTEGHGAAFPLELAEMGIDKFCTGSIVYEPFCGTGTTILAAHNLGRKCYSLEISEKYGAVILQRFLDATGIQPELMG